MGTNTSLANIILLATMSSSVLSMNYELDTFIPKMNYKFSYQSGLTDWKDNAFNHSTDYQLLDESLINIQTIINFSKKVISNTKDIDNEFVDIVNDNFWDLI